MTTSYDSNSAVYLPLYIKAAPVPESSDGGLSQNPPFTEILPEARGDVRIRSMEDRWFAFRRRDDDGIDKYIEQYEVNGQPLIRRNPILEYILGLLDYRNDPIRMFFFISKPRSRYPALHGFDCYRTRDIVEVDGCGRVDEIDLDTE